MGGLGGVTTEGGPGGVTTEGGPEGSTAEVKSLSSPKSSFLLWPLPVLVLPSCSFILKVMLSSSSSFLVLAANRLDCLFFTVDGVLLGLSIPEIVGGAGVKGEVVGGAGVKGEVVGGAGVRVEVVGGAGVRVEVVGEAGVRVEGRPFPSG